MRRAFVVRHTGPMTLIPTEAGFLHSGTEDLATLLVIGDGAGWPGDPRLDLRIGVIREKATGRKGRRYEVWRSNEDGSESRIGHWKVEEFDRILFDLSRMRMDSPGHVSAEAEVDAANAAIEQKRSDEARDALGEMMEHAAKLHHDTNEPKNVFRQIGGFADKQPDVTTSNVYDDGHTNTV